MGMGMAPGMGMGMAPGMGMGMAHGIGMGPAMGMAHGMGMGPSMGMGGGMRPVGAVGVYSVEQGMPSAGQGSMGPQMVDTRDNSPFVGQHMLAGAEEPVILDAEDYYPRGSRHEDYQLSDNENEAKYNEAKYNDSERRSEFPGEFRGSMFGPEDVMQQSMDARNGPLVESMDILPSQ
ncbi:hypothetical protein GNI_022130 [Gregarina niphandrodes]|uniref:Uncharacterized protein n=1 Tax=Gregarina niphandrodes TaxID=110365 RepID=A0A023BBX8_GRENI|nr:hypothetical protein GNI_022130 [Gregarina niphandrodes]EZG80244.1 hypothetical protein GNI_022130 [Gregarina niphandrodes]|eukprot:XP_011134315.1 hypothetical protein GNI_022130 [Gregarina niphandrodes]